MARKHRKNEPIDPMIKALEAFRSREAVGWDDAWVGMEPTFQSPKSVRKWAAMAVDEKGEDAYFRDSYMLEKQRSVAEAIRRRYEKRRSRDDSACMFARVRRDSDLDQWGVRRQTLAFRWKDRKLEDFEVRFSLDPETFEYSIKPVPLAWFYDVRFLRFLEEFLWRAPQKAGLSASIAHGGAQFSLSAKTFLTGSLLADDIATKLNHPELALWTMDWPNADDRSFRATKERLAAFRLVLEQYWAGAFHPRAKGILTVENCLLERGFEPSPRPPLGLMHPEKGPLGDDREVFQTNFAFGRWLRLSAQNIHPGYWQSAGPKTDGYRPDQIMRYSEGNLNRLQIAGEFHVKSARILDEDRVPKLRASLDRTMLTEEASWENRGQMGRTSARDYVEALLLDVHHARFLAAHPHVRVIPRLLQDELLGDGAATVRAYGGKGALSKLRAEALRLNAEVSHGRIKDDWIEPETLMWAAWRAMPPAKKAAVAHEIVAGFVERVEEAASCDPRPESKTADPLAWHRHRIDPQLWEALAPGIHRLEASDPVRREYAAFQADAETYLARRPRFSQTGRKAPCG